MPITPPTELPKRLRSEAEAELLRMPVVAPTLRSPEELLHELQVHQIELEMQNEELLRAQHTLEESLDRYVDLYDFAPTGYFTINSTGLITEGNLAGAKLLRKERHHLLSRRFAPLVIPADRDRWQAAFKSEITDGNGMTFELGLLRGDGTVVYARIDTMRTVSSDGTKELRISLTDISAQRKVESELQETRRLLNESSHVGKCGGWEVDIATGKQEWTREVYDIHEVDFDFIPTVENGIKFYAQGSRPVIEEAVRKAIDQGKPFNMELSIITAKGNLRTVITKGIPDLNNGRVYGFFQDITERKHEEGIISAVQERMRAILETVADPIFVKDNDHRIVVANSSFYKMFGLEKEAVIGRTLAEHVPEEERQHFLAVDRQVLDSGLPDMREESLTVAGVPRTIITNKTRLIDDSGAKFLVGSIHDITEIKESNLFKESLLKTIPFPIDIVDSTGRVLYMNTQMERLVGSPRLGEECWMLYRDNRQQCEACPLTKKVSPDRTAKVESSGVFGGKTFEIQHTAMAYQGKEAILEIFLDITERKQIEEQTAERNRELKQLYASLLTARETERQRLARELHDDLGLRVTALRMDVDWIEAKIPPATPSLTAKMATVGPQIDDLADAIRRLIEDMRPGMLDTLGLSAALDDYVAKFVARTGIKCELSFGPEDSSVNGDVAIDMFRIVQEALNNVQKYAEASRVSLMLLQKDHSISLMIEDDGIGFPETTHAAATGFGLRGMRERVANLGGQLSITSQAGQGVRIEVVIPTGRGT